MRKVAPSPWLPPVILLVLSLGCVVTIDFPVGAAFSKTPLDGPVERLLDAAEHFGTPFGQILVLIAIGALRHYWEPRLIRLIAASSVAGLAANVVKLLVGRVRPQAFDFKADNIWDTFTGWLALGAGGSDLQSFPSGHTASAVGFALALSWAYPQGRGAYWLMAVLVGLHRIASGAHYPSDVFAGAAAGWLTAVWFVRPSPLSDSFDGWERTWETWNPWRKSVGNGNQG